MRIDFYTRAGCSLCDDAQLILDRVAGEGGYHLIDVDSDPELARTHGEFVPVVEVDGVRVAHWHVDEARLREAISGQTKRAPRRLFGRRRAR